MSGRGARARVHRARVELDEAEQQFDLQWQPWRERLGRHRLALLIGGGMLGGFTLAMVSPKRWSHLGAALFGGSAWLARSAIGPAVLGVLWKNILGSSAADQSAANGAAPPGA